jgi:phosphate transport system substrate-binding protein
LREKRQERTMRLRYLYTIILCLVMAAAPAALGGCSQPATEQGADGAVAEPDADKDAAADAAATEQGAGTDAAAEDPGKLDPDVSSVQGILPGIDESAYPRVDGSTANLPLLAGLYAEVCGVSKEEAETKVSVSKTDQAWWSLTEENADLIVAYEPVEETMNKVKRAGVIYDPIGRDGLVFLTGKDNPVESLTVDQLRDIYAGKIKNWSEVGGKDEQVAAYQRNESSGSQVMFEKLVMKGEKPMDAPTEFRPGDMGSLIASLAEFDGAGSAIGYSVYYYADLMYAAPELKMLAVDGVTPSAETIASGAYKLTNDFYVAVPPGRPADSPAMRIRDYLLTPAGAGLMKDLGYVPLS